MHQSLGTVTLKSGERVEAGVVVAPDASWRERIAGLLHHKGEPWNWQNAELLRGHEGIDACFHVLHRDGVPFCHILTVERAGVGLLGHVFTRPEERGRGAVSQLMRLQMDFFRSRGGKALYLGTRYDEPPFRIYRKFGFEPVEPRSGTMAWFAPSRAAFEEAYFAPTVAEVRPLAWRHWPAAAPLFAGGFPGIARNVAFRLIGRRLPEEPLLQPLRENQTKHADGQPATTLVLEKPDNGAVVGLASWRWDVWPNTCLVDCYCHPAFWSEAASLCASLELPNARRYVSYVEPGCEMKRRCLEAIGFRPALILPGWLAADDAATQQGDVELWERLA